MDDTNTAVQLFIGLMSLALGLVIGTLIATGILWLTFMIAGPQMAFGDLVVPALVLAVCQGFARHLARHLVSNG